VSDHAAGLFLHPDALGYDFGPQHPMQPVRLVALMDLLHAFELIGEEERPECSPAERRDLLRAHGAAYLDAVESLDNGAGAQHGNARLAERFGLGPGDTPAFAGMHRASSAIAGATLAAIRAVLAGQIMHAFSPAGGLHHAMRDRASGFCVYNDLVVAMADAVAGQPIRILYVDFDAHHGDGVQAAFYAEPRVMTVSLHESGRYLFPGTGDVSERGSGEGFGYAINLPFAPFTADEAWLDAAEAVLPRLCERFKPDLIVSQHGCDGHLWDPLTHLALTCNGLTRAAALVHRLAHAYCSGRWVAAGGGGYQPLRVVPRAWAALWAEMTARPVGPSLPAGWLQRWNAASPLPIPATVADAEGLSDPGSDQPTVAAENDSMIDQVEDLLKSESGGADSRRSGDRDG